MFPVPAICYLIRLSFPYLCRPYNDIKEKKNANVFISKARRLFFFF